MPNTPAVSVQASRGVAVAALPAHPRVTIVIPTRDEEGSIGDMIDAVRGYADEVLVVDGHSKDRTRDVADGQGRARHAGRRQGQGRGDAPVARGGRPGDIVVFIDADGSHEATRHSRRCSRRSWPARPTWSSARAARAAATSCTARRAVPALRRVAADHAGDQLPVRRAADRQPERLPRASPRRRHRARHDLEPDDHRAGDADAGAQARLPGRRDRRATSTRAAAASRRWSCGSCGGPTSGRSSVTSSDPMPQTGHPGLARVARADSSSERRAAARLGLHGRPGSSSPPPPASVSTAWPGARRTSISTSTSTSSSSVPSACA